MILDLPSIPTLPNPLIFVASLGRVLKSYILQYLLNYYLVVHLLHFLWTLYVMFNLKKKTEKRKNYVKEMMFYMFGFLYENYEKINK